MTAPATPPAIPRVLSIAGSDPSGGAGIQADLKSIAALGGYGLAAVTALTAQNTTGVTGVHVPPPEFLRAQLDAIASDIELDAVKIGMLGEASVVDVVRDWLIDSRPPAVVLDPVMVSTSGARLLDAAAEAGLRALLAHVDVVTPNLPELAVLLAEPAATSWADACAQAARLAARHDVLVLVKGGHLTGDRSPDALVDPSGRIVELDGERIATTSTHGTGCSLSSALATRFAATGDWAAAAREAKAWLGEAIRGGAALRVGHGHGPIDHLVRMRTAEQAHEGMPEAERSPAAEGERLPRPEQRREAGPEQSHAPGEQHSAGPHATRWWDDSAKVRAAIDELAFIRGLADGTLRTDAFRHYLEQDALYLRDYARVLARASALAPTPAEQGFWAAAAQSALTVELRSHERRLGRGEGPDAPPAASAASAATRAYLDHLASAGPDYGTVVAAALPCYWIYDDVGVRLAAHARPGHPYREWLESYADPAFAASTRSAIAFANAAAARADEQGRARMARAFRISAEHELAFFAQSDHLLG